MRKFRVRADPGAASGRETSMRGIEPITAGFAVNPHDGVRIGDWLEERERDAQRQIVTG
jgi:hypothetical protein